MRGEALQIQMQTRACTRAHTSKRPCTHTCVHILTNVLADKQMQAYRHTYARTHLHLCMHTCVHTHTYSQMHTHRPHTVQIHYCDRKLRSRISLLPSTLVRRNVFGQNLIDVPVKSYLRLLFEEVTQSVPCCLYTLCDIGVVPRD